MNGLVKVGHYRREFAVDIERLFENALDWEHLPHLHGDSFSAIEIVTADREGWRSTVTLDDGRTMALNLALTESGWVTRTEAGGELLSEIRTTAAAAGPERCTVSVTFHVAAQSAERNAAAGAYFERLYATLYDDDERMMIARTEAKRRSAEEWRRTRDVTLADGRTFAVPLYCPHQGLPLDAKPDAEGIITCPWHGYRFDVATGDNVSGQTCGWQRR